MIPFKKKRFGKSFLIPSSWEDLTVDQFLKVSESEKDTEVFEIITGLNQKYYDRIKPYTTFLESEIDISEIESKEYFLLKDEIFKVPDVSSCEYGQKIVFGQKHRSAILSDKIMVSFPELISVYLQPVIFCEKFDIEKLDGCMDIILKMPIFDAFGIYMNILDQYSKLIEKEQATLFSSTTFEQESAGVEKFNQLGEFNTIDNIATNYKYTHNEVEKLEYNLVYLILLKQKISSDYEKNYSLQMKLKK